MKVQTESGSSDYFFSSLLEVHNNKDFNTRQKLFAYRSVFNEFLRFLTKNEKQIFSSNFSRLIYIIDKYELSKETADELSRLRKLNGYWLSGGKKEIPQNVPTITLALTIKFIELMTGAELSEELRSIADSLASFASLPVQTASAETIATVKVSVLKVIKDIIYAEDENSNKIKIELINKWKTQIELIHPSSVLNLIDFDAELKGDVLYLKNNKDSIMVLEPDYLMDVTDVSSCYNNNKPDAGVHFLKKFTQNPINDTLLLGSIINSIFDELLINSDTGFEECYAKAIAVKPLSIFALAVKDPAMVLSIKEKARIHYTNIKKQLPNIMEGRISIEPSFISPKYGLQGRLDVLTEFSDDERRKNILELKSGKSAPIDLSINIPGGNKIRTGIWNEHYAQTILYNLLLDSTYANRSGSTRIFYSVDSLAPLRDAPNIINKKQEVVFNRNLLAAEELKFISGNYEVLRNLKPEYYNDAASFTVRDLLRFHGAFLKLSEVERKYFINNVAFCLSEMFAARLGDDSGKNAGFSSLWLDSVEDKQRSYNIAANLKIDYEESDFESMHIELIRYGNPITSFRKGDFCIIYPADFENGRFVINDQIIKCHIIEISNTHISISLRNKQLSREYLEKYTEWILEPDSIDTTTRLIQSFSGFIYASDRKRGAILGTFEPKFNRELRISSPILNDKQNMILQKAISAEDYFIIQGPPGTGKTSFMLREIVRLLHKSSEENILILAYTNRAVDEICSALKDISQNFPFLRLGNKESSEHSDKLISYLAETTEFRDLYKTILNTRVFVSTVSSVITNPEIFLIKDFRTTIVDEASQILEPYLSGILAQSERFILIGDEKQLPAIVLQSEGKLNISDASLNGLEMKANGTSLFERLLKICKKNQWFSAFDMLNEQARMHFEIQSLANSLFYEEQLKTLSGWQTQIGPVYEGEAANELEKVIFSHRTVFVSVRAEKTNKVNKSEIVVIHDILKIIREKSGDAFDESTVGIISPFRAQVAEIIKSLPEDLKNKVTVDTVERFQGSERDTIIISFALNNSFLLSSVQSLAEIDGRMTDRKLNVAITRARKQLIILGTPHLLGESAVFSKLIYLIKSIGGFLEENSTLDSAS